MRKIIIMALVAVWTFIFAATYSTISKADLMINGVYDYNSTEYYVTISNSALYVHRVANDGTVLSSQITELALSSFNATTPYLEVRFHSGVEPTAGSNVLAAAQAVDPTIVAIQPYPVTLDVWTVALANNAIVAPDGVGTNVVITIGWTGFISTWSNHLRDDHNVVRKADPDSLSDLQNAISILEGQRDGEFSVTGLNSWITALKNRVTYLQTPKSGTVTFDSVSYSFTWVPGNWNNDVNNVLTELATHFPSGSMSNEPTTDAERDTILSGITSMEASGVVLTSLKAKINTYIFLQYYDFVWAGTTYNLGYELADYADGAAVRAAIKLAMAPAFQNPTFENRDMYVTKLRALTNIVNINDFADYLAALVYNVSYDKTIDGVSYTLTYSSSNYANNAAVDTELASEVALPADNVVNRNLKVNAINAVQNIGGLNTWVSYLQSLVFWSPVTKNVNGTSIVFEWSSDGYGQSLPANIAINGIIALPQSTNVERNAKLVALDTNTAIRSAAYEAYLNALVYFVDVTYVKSIDSVDYTLVYNTEDYANNAAVDTAIANVLAMPETTVEEANIKVAAIKSLPLTGLDALTLLIGQLTPLNDDAADAQHTSDIATNVTDIETNSSDIATNVTDIATNVLDIAANKLSSATNATNITTNTGNISSNLSSLGTLSGQVTSLNNSVGSLNTKSTANANDIIKLEQITVTNDGFTTTVGSLDANNGDDAKLVSKSYVDSENDEQDTAIALNTAKVGITVDQANTITSNFEAIANNATNIGNNSTDIGTLNTTVSDLDTAYKAADTALEALINGLDLSGNGVVQSSLATQLDSLRTSITIAYTSVTDGLANRITALEAQVQLNKENIADNFDLIGNNQSRINSVVEDVQTNLQSIDDNLNDIAANTTKISEVETNYKAADVALKADYIAKDTALKSELETAISNGDAAVISNLEAQIVALDIDYATADAALKVQLTNAYEAADVLLSDRIDTNVENIATNAQSIVQLANDIAVNFNATVANATKSATNATDISALETSVSNLDAAYKLADDGLSTLISNLTSTVSNLDLSGNGVLQADMEVDLATLKAEITAEYTSVTNTLSARITALEAVVANNTADISTNNSLIGINETRIIDQGVDVQNNFQSTVDNENAIDALDNKVDTKADKSTVSLLQSQADSNSTKSYTNTVRVNSAHNKADTNTQSIETLKGFSNWVGSSYYVIGDVVAYNGKLYRANQNTNNPSWSYLQWDLVSDTTSIAGNSVAINNNTVALDNKADTTYVDSENDAQDAAQLLTDQAQNALIDANKLKADAAKALADANKILADANAAAIAINEATIIANKALADAKNLAQDTAIKANTDKNVEQDGKISDNKVNITANTGNITANSLSIGTLDNRSITLNGSEVFVNTSNTYDLGTIEGIGGSNDDKADAKHSSGIAQNSKQITALNGKIDDHAAMNFASTQASNFAGSEGLGLGFAHSGDSYALSATAKKTIGDNFNVTGSISSSTNGSSSQGFGLNWSWK